MPLTGGCGKELSAAFIGGHLMVAWIRALLAVAAGAAFLYGAADFWEAKDLNSWTDKDVQQIMTDSPWAKQMPMPVNGRPQMVVVDPRGDGNGPPPAAALGNPSNTTTGANLSTSGGPGANGPADPNGLHQLPISRAPSTIGPTGVPEPTENLTIIWASATPIRLAVLKIRHSGETITQHELDEATKPRENYVIAVTGLPAPEYDGDLKRFAGKASLTVKGKTPLSAHDVYFRVIGNSNVYFFRFPKAAMPINASDGEVDFRAIVGTIDIKRKFELKDMHYKDQLSL